jgi:hypothetical protein
MPGTKPHTPPAAISPLHVRQLPLSTVRAFGPAAWRLRRSVAPPFGRGVPHEPCLRRVYYALCGRLRAGQGGVLPPQSYPGHPAALPRSAVIPSVHRRRMYQAQSTGGWRALRSRARSPRRYHTSYPVRVPRPAPSCHAACRPPLTVTPWRVPGPSAPRTPGQETCTPTHDRMHGTHASCTLFVLVPPEGPVKTPLCRADQQRCRVPSGHTSPRHP